MSFNYLPPNVLILLLFFVSFALFYYSRNRAHIDGMLTAAGYFVLGVVALCEAIDKIMFEYFSVNTSNPIYILILTIIGFLGLILMFIGGWKKVNNNPVRKKVLLICIIIIVLSLLSIGILIYTA